MKRSISARLLILAILLISVLMFSACKRKESPYHPAAAPTATPYPTGTIDTIEDANITEGYIGTMEIDGTDYPVVIHDSLSYCIIGDEARVVNTLFTDDALEEYNIADTVEYESVSYPVTSIDEDAFYGFYDALKINIPSSIKTIGAYAFDSCDAAVEINIAEGVEVIGESAFNDCSDLESIVIPSTVREMGTNVFYGCSSLEKVVFKEGVTAIPDETFTNCEALKTVEIPSSVQSIGYEAFWGCEALASIQIPEGVTFIDDRCFYDCIELTAVVLPSTLTVIGDGIFDECDKLSTIMVPKDCKEMFEDLFEEYEINIVTH
ncbi:MAG: leucine-rich repeat domain-containing protein [Lachnospiraceae bacterium]|nr:leucine-rich repeat domain-containing protein [Lachnospiraceae bacterium]